MGGGWGDCKEIAALERGVGTCELRKISNPMWASSSESASCAFIKFIRVTKFISGFFLHQLFKALTDTE